MAVYLELFHGRHSPDEELNDWGFEGPVLGPFPYVHITYGSHIKLGQPGLELSIGKDGFVNFAGGYYGDMSTFSLVGAKKNFGSGWAGRPEIMVKRIKETQKVFQTDPELLVSDERDWVKLYCEWRLKNGSNTREPSLTGRTRRTTGSRRRKNP